MEHKLTIGFSNKTTMNKVVAYKKISLDTKVKDVIGDASKGSNHCSGRFN